MYEAFKVLLLLAISVCSGWGLKLLVYEAFKVLLLLATSVCSGWGLKLLEYGPLQMESCPRAARDTHGY